MATSVQKIVGEPIVIVTHTDPFDYTVDVYSAGEQLSHIAEKVKGTLHIVIDISRVKLSFEDAMVNLMREAIKEPVNIVNGGNVTLTFIGGNDSLVEMMQKSYRYVPRNSTSSRLYTSLTEALTALRTPH